MQRRAARDAVVDGEQRLEARQLGALTSDPGLILDLLLVGDAFVLLWPVVILFLC